MSDWSAKGDVLIACNSGAIHEGGGRAACWLDDRADASQRAGLTRLLRGELGGAWGVFIKTYELPEPVVERFEMHIAAHGSRAKIGSAVELELQTIRNPVTQAEVHPEVVLPEGLVVKRGGMAASKLFRGGSPVLMTIFSWLLWALANAPWLQLPPPEAWSQANAATRRLDPSEFVELPAVLRAELRRRGCTIPQAYTGGSPHNVVRGELKAAGTVDWAALCSVKRASSIIVFWGGKADAASEIAHRPDADFLQVVGSGQIGFSRAISVASPDYIRERHRRYGGPRLPPLTHAGINDAFLEKASVVWYWHEGKWLQLTGAD